MKAHLFLLVFLLSSIGPTVNADEDDTQEILYNGGPQHTGFYRSEPLREKPVLKWKFPVEKGISSPPLLHNDVLFFGDWSGYFYAVNIHTGKLKWKYAAGKSVGGPPTIVGPTAYWGCGEGILYALDVRTGQVKWSFESDGYKMGIDASICFPPLVYDGFAYFTSHDSTMYVVDIESSKSVYKFKAESTMCSSPSRCDDVVFFSDGIGNIFAFDTVNRHEKWRFKCGAKTYHAPAIARGVGYVCSHDHFVYAIELSSGKEIWRFESDAKISSDPAVHNGVVYFNTLMSHFYALDAASGKLLWDAAKAGKVYAKPAIAGSMTGDYAGDIDGLNRKNTSRATVYFGGGDHFLYALDAETGEELWSFEAEAMVCYPTTYGGKIFFGSGTHLYVLE